MTKMYVLVSLKHKILSKRQTDILKDRQTYITCVHYDESNSYPVLCQPHFATSDQC